MPVTLRDIADKVGVSMMTVSRSLNGEAPSMVSPALRQRIRKAAEQLGYHPNVNARALARNQSMLIGVLYNGVNFLQSTQFLAGLQEVCVARDYAPLFLSHQNAAMERANLRLCLRRKVDALIVNPWVENEDPDPSRTGRNFQPPTSPYQKIIKSGLPLTEVFGRQIPGVCSVRYDHLAEGRLATRHLIEHGHRRIVLFTHAWYRAVEKIPGLCFDAYEQWQGYAAEMGRIDAEPVVVAHPLTFQPTLRSDPMTFYHAAMESAHSVFDHPTAPTAVVCYSAYQALAVLKIAQARGIHVPTKLSLVSGDDFPFAWPDGQRLTCIVRDPTEAGRVAAKTVFAQLGAGTAMDAAIAPTLQPGETVADIKDRAARPAPRGYGKALAGRRVTPMQIDGRQFSRPRLPVANAIRQRGKQDEPPRRQEHRDQALVMSGSVFGIRSPAMQIN